MAGYMSKVECVYVCTSRIEKNYFPLMTLEKELRYLHTHSYNNTIHNSQKIETTQVFNDGWASDLINLSVSVCSSVEPDVIVLGLQVCGKYRM